MSIMKLSAVLPGLALAAALGCLLAAQEPAPSKPDSPQVKALVEKAKKDGGTMWATEAHFFCEDPHANSLNDPFLEPTKIFDNVYALGRAGTTMYALTTSAGIILIDTGYPNEAESVLIDQMKKVNLDPAQVKMIVLGHGHADHFGGAPYFQEHYGTHVYLTQADWDFMEHPPAARGGGGKAPKGPPPAMPKHDMVITEGQPIKLGEETIMPYYIPGHTPGSTGFIFQVKDNGKTHTAAIYGGTILTPGPISDENLAIYLKSVGHFREETKKAKVDVELQNHSLYDNIQDKIAKLKERKKGEPNPFVVGQGNYQKFMDVMYDCSQVNVDRRKDQASSTR
jgi:metallo-beta-lactamase class B